MNIESLTRAVIFSDIFELYGTKWNKIAQHPNLPPEFIDTYFHYLKPFNIEATQTIPNYLQIKYRSAWNWVLMSKFQSLSEQVIILMSHKVNWCYVSKYQELSLEFIQKYHHNLDFSMMMNNKKISATILCAVKPLFVK